MKHENRDLPSACARFLRAFERSAPRDGECHAAWNGERLFARFEWQENETPVAELHVQLFPAQAQLWIGSVEIADASRGRGLGRRLVRGLENGALGAGVRSIRLFSRRKAAGFWQRLGYEAEADRRYFRKSLPHPPHPRGRARRNGRKPR